MTKQYTSIHAEAGLHRKLVLFAATPGAPPHSTPY